MKYMRELLRDRKRAQRGSVLSGVLIIVAFIGIISGALMTELSTHFLISRALVNRVGTEATVNSAVELALDRLQNTPISSGCPKPETLDLNSMKAAVSYTSCVPVVDSASLPLQPIAQSNPFTTDGSHALINGQDLYLLADASGLVSQYRFGQRSPEWSRQLATLTGPPLEMPDASSNPPGIISLVPIAGNQVALLGQSPGRRTPEVSCFMGASAQVTTRPAAGVAFPQIAYIADSRGGVYAYTATVAGNCSRLASMQPNGDPVVAGPIVFQGAGSTDEIYVVTTSVEDGNRVVHYTYTSGSTQLKLVSRSLGLPANPIGMVGDGSPRLPASVAIAFAGGEVYMLLLQTGVYPTISATANVPPTVVGAPFWCHCSGGVDLIGIANSMGGLYVFDTLLTPYATYPAGGVRITTTPVADAVGDWFFGASDGYLYEVQKPAGQSTMIFAARFALSGAVTSSPAVGACWSTWLCIYLGTQNGRAYLVPLDARDATVTACITILPPTCSGTNPRLWAQVEVGSFTSPQTVRVTGWSYYSP